jgi:hypothetical protein
MAGRRPPGRAAALQEAMKRRTPASTCSSSRAPSPRRRTASTARSAAETALDILEEAPTGRRHHRHRLLRLLGRHPVRRPEPDRRHRRAEVLKGKTVVTIPGCPANPYNFLGTVLQYATFGTLPSSTPRGRPKFAYGRTIHEHCPRRAHFDAGRFAEQFGDAGHREGWCLYKLGCKGPETYANCSTQHFNEVPTPGRSASATPASAAPSRSSRSACRCTQTVDIERPRRPTPTRRSHAEQGVVSPLATGVAGVIGGAASAPAWMAPRRATADDGDRRASRGEGGHEASTDVRAQGRPGAGGGAARRHGR